MIPGMQGTLFDCGYPPRPKMYGGDVTELVLDALMPKVLDWMRSAGDDPDTMSDGYVAEVRDDIRDAIEHEDDGYKIVRALERDGWSVDRELVDILDDAIFERIEAHKSAVKAWVTTNNVSPKFSVGQRVTFKQRPFDKETVTGEVTKVVDDEATYVVFVESLGHVRNGPGTYGICVPYEFVEALNP